MQLSEIIITLLSSFVSVALGLVVLLSDKRSKSNIAFFFAATFTALWIVALYFTESNNLPLMINQLSNHLAYVFSYLSIASFVLFTLYFGSKKYSIRQKIIIYIVLAAGVLFASTNSVAGSVSRLPNNELSFSNGPGLVWYAVVLFLVATVGIYNLFYTFYKTQGKKRQQAKMILIGFVCTFALTLIANSIIPIITNQWNFAKYAPIFTLFVLSFTAYAIIKQGLFDIKPYIARVTGYALTLFLVMIIFIFLSFTIIRVFFDTQVTLAQDMLFAVFSALIALLFQPIKSFFDKVTSFIFFQNPYNPQRVLSELNNLLASSIELSSIVKGSDIILQKHLKPQFITFFINKNYEQQAIYSSRDSATKHLANAVKAINKHLSNTNSKLLIKTNQLDEELSQLLMKYNISVALRLTANNEDLGLLVLGDPKSGSNYYYADIQLLETAVDSMAIAVQNALRFDEISQFNLTLQEKVNKATHQLQNSNEKLQKLDEAKDEFISMASHQLRTPLTSVKGYVSMVLEGDAGEINEQQRIFLNQALVSSQRMVYLIADLLNVSRLKTGKFLIESRPTYLPDVVESEVSQLYETAQARGLTLKFTKPKTFPTISLDETKIRQVIMNFVDNAIYYTPKGGKITVGLKANAKSIEFTVADTGIGVSKQDQHKLFSKFYRAGNARKARPDGTGLGLYMAKKVVVAQGGAIIFETKENQGSVFGFTFPIPASPTEKH